MFESIKNTEEFKLLSNAVNTNAATTALFGLPSVGRAEMISAVATELQRCVIVVTEGEAEATKMAQDIKFFGGKSAIFPARDLTLRGVEGQNREYEYRRLAVLGDIVGGRVNVLCVPIEGALLHTVPKTDFCENTLTLKPNMEISIKDLALRMLNAGYYHREQVDGDGQFSIRGGIVDIFAPDMVKPARLEFWGDEIESITSFDLLTQRREESLKKIYISPAREVLCGDPTQTLQMLTSFANTLKGDKKNRFETAIKAETDALSAD
ncbi:MAG: transcription-repair coupling factor, partial [Oscillospiraceae bacterium]